MIVVFGKAVVLPYSPIEITRKLAAAVVRHRSGDLKHRTELREQVSERESSRSWRGVRRPSERLFCLCVTCRIIRAIMGARWAGHVARTER
jgi:hypothetical protein